MDVSSGRAFAVVAVAVAVVAVVAAPPNAPAAVAEPTCGDGSGLLGTLRSSDVARTLGLGTGDATRRFSFQRHLLVDALGNENVYVTDYNGDHRPDLLAVGGGTPVLLNNTGDGFERSGALAGLDGPFKGALAFDYDGDGDDDLLLLAPNGTVLLENRGGTFTRRPDAIDLSMEVPVGAAAADFDGDGTLDVFVVGYENWYDNAPAGYRGNGTVVRDNGNPNRLFLGNGSAFSRADDVGLEGDRWSLAASFVDLTGDGRPDVHVANDFNNDVLYVNRNGTHFDRRVLPESTDRNEMASEVADVNGDGRLDIFETNIYGFDTRDGKMGGRMLLPLEERAKGNNLLINRGNGTWGARAGPSHGRKAGGGWAAVVTDLDDDGHDDVFHATQIVVTRGQQSSNLTKPRLFERVGDRFVSRNASRSGFAETDGRGVAELDYDRDGDEDLVVASAMGRFFLYENTGAPGDSIEIQVASATNRTPIGAEVTVTTDGTSQYEVLNSKADFKSQDTRTLHFGLGDAEHVDRVQVTWPDGTTRTLRDVRSNQLLVVDQHGVRDRLEFGGSC